jgi:hypothetical protein
MKLPKKIMVGRRLYRIHQVKQIADGLMGEVGCQSSLLLLNTTCGTPHKRRCADGARSKGASLIPNTRRKK